MGLISKVLGGGLGALLGGVSDIVDKFHMSPKDAAKMKFELEALLQKRESELEQTIRKELEAKEKVLVAELNQSDLFTKRARPTVVYGGLLMIFVNYLIVPLVQSVGGVAVGAFPLPTEFWVAWGGIVSTWVVGRSAEKMGMRNRAVSLLVGKGKSLLDL